MTFTSRKSVLAIASALSFIGLTAVSADANYLGYANGDPTNENFWQEQGVEPIDPSPARIVLAPRPHHVHHIVGHHLHGSKRATG